MLCFPPAKINLGLAVHNKQSDRYHDIETLFHSIKLYDILEVVENTNSKNDDDTLSLSGLAIDSELRDNLVWKALLVMRIHYQFPSVKIHLHKQIPYGAGLGGGSSDAAYTLLTINHLFKLNIDPQKLEEIALEIGSDCPFFIRSGIQYAKGRGEILSPFKLTLEKKTLLIVIPNLPISTAWAYQNIKANTSLIRLNEALQRPIKTWKRDLKNDFESIVFAEFPELEEIKLNLYESGAIYASLSGSGSALFGIFDEKKQIRLKSEYKTIWMDF